MKIELKLARRNVIQPVPPAPPQTVAPKQLFRVSTFTPTATDNLSGSSSSPFLCGYKIGDTLYNVRYHVLSSSPFTRSYQVDTYDLLTGAFLATVQSGTFDGMAGYSTNQITGGSKNSKAAFMQGISGPGGDNAGTGRWLYDGVTSPDLSPNVSGPWGTTWTKSINSALVQQNGYLYSCGGKIGNYSFIVRWVANSPDGNPASAEALNYTILDSTSAAQGNAWEIGTTEGVDDIYVMGQDPDNAAQQMLFQFTADLTLIKTWNQTSLPSGYSTFFCVIGDPYIIFQHVDGVQKAWCYKIEDNLTFTLINKVNCAGGNLVALGDGYILCADGVLQLRTV